MRFVGGGGDQNVIIENLPTGSDLTREQSSRDRTEKSLRAADNKRFIVLQNPNHNNKQSLIRFRRRGWDMYTCSVEELINSFRIANVFVLT